MVLMLVVKMLVLLLRVALLGVDQIVALVSFALN